MRYFEVWEGDLYHGIFYEDELWQFEGLRYMRYIDISI